MPGRAYLDGEIAVLTAEGILDLEVLQVAPGQSAKSRLVYVVFDICTSPDAIRPVVARGAQGHPGEADRDGRVRQPVFKWLRG